MKNKKSMRRLVSVFLAIVMSVCLLSSMTATVGAVNQAVLDAKSGVVHIEVCFVDDEVGYREVLAHGSGFLINEETVITANHVIAFPDEVFVQWTQLTNMETGATRTVAQVKECLQIRISVYDDVFINATVVKASENMDYAILALDQTIGGRTPLAIRNSESLVQTENVHVLGFPGDLFDIDQLREYDINSVAVLSGKVEYVANEDYFTDDGVQHTNVNVVTSSVNTSGGTSGGPLVDDNGYVVGVNTAINTEGRANATSSRELIKVLEALGIPCTIIDSKIDPEPTTNPEPTTDPKPITRPEPTTDPEPATNPAPTTEVVENEEGDDDKNDKKDDESGDNTMLIAIIAGAAVLVLAVIIIAVSSSKKKKKVEPAAVPVAAAVQAPRAPQAAPVNVAPRAPQPPVRPAASYSPETSVLNNGYGETTVLGAGSGETTVLSQMVNGGVLIRTSNNERIHLSSADFTVGRERAKVDYCIGGNTNISRVHARFVVRNGVTYIVDNRAANGTFVNGVKTRPGQEIELKQGDKIMLADESFEYIK